MNNLDKKYTALLKNILDNGVTKKDRTGTGTKSLFGCEITHNMSEGFPLLTTKKMYFKGIITELIWFLRGETNIKYLVENDCHIWDGDAYKNYEKEYEKVLTGITPKRLLEENPNWKPHKLNKEEFVEFIKTNESFAKQWGELGPIYGKQWRKWEYGDYKTFKNGETYPNGEFKYDIRREYIDQIANLINELKNNPDSRRLMVNAWNVSEVDKAVLPPCHYGFQCWTRELTLDERVKLTIQHPEFDPIDFGIGIDARTEEHDHHVCDAYNTPRRAISLLWNQRSVDTFLGLPFNIASYGLLLQIIGREVNMLPEKLIGKLGDTHIYLNHIEQAQEQMSREPFHLPSVETTFNGNIIEKIGEVSPNDFILKDYESHSTIKAKLSN